MVVMRLKYFKAPGVIFLSIWFALSVWLVFRCSASEGSFYEGRPISRENPAWLCLRPIDLPGASWVGRWHYLWDTRNWRQLWNTLQTCSGSERRDWFLQNQDISTTFLVSCLRFLCPLSFYSWALHKSIRNTTDPIRSFPQSRCSQLFDSIVSIKLTCWLSLSLYSAHVLLLSFKTRLGLLPSAPGTSRNSLLTCYS